MHVSRAQAKEVGRTEVSDRVGDLGVLDQFRTRRGAGREVEQQGVRGQRARVREPHVLGDRVGVAE